MRQTKLATRQLHIISYRVRGQEYLYEGRRYPEQMSGIQTGTRLIELKPNSITLAGSKLVADRFEAKFHSNQIR